jgi:hypothetical protein
LVRAGGLLGFYFDNNGIANMNVTLAYSTGAVSGSSLGELYLGGLAGDADDPNALFSNTYWDKDTSGQSHYARGRTDRPKPNIRAQIAA